MAQGSWRRSAVLSSLAGAALSVLGTGLALGIPGAFVLIFAAPLISVIYGVGEANLFPSDSAWPFMLFLTLLMGPLVPALWLGTRRMGLSGWRRAFWMTGGMMLGSTLLAVGLYAISVGPSLR
ncbi:hypothetical protein [Roseococcus pinisoli]|uniref:Uncharacterized protein n=1 Tax=Roseococcus pinisoli TaxID=2835040 RepID=A0ABS5QAB8_9PROT|nr:hypothetical protein [Roseococcus pinisoli]MBS7810610.1 hypothetical protein [Roseococcus pinisoli]